MIHEHQIKVKRTARYCTLGNLHPDTREIWLVMHGYAQLAKEFLLNFECIQNNERFIIAPEALSRFYTKGFGGKPGASWMTSENRVYEIEDYVAYLEQLAQQVVPQTFQGKIVVLGFSQGTATATRWLNSTHFKVDTCILYAGEVAAELREPVAQKLMQTNMVYVTGHNDPFLKKELRESVRNMMNKINACTIEFEGGHEIKPDVLRDLASLIEQKK